MKFAGYHLCTRRFELLEGSERDSAMWECGIWHRCHMSGDMLVPTFFRKSEPKIYMGERLGAEDLIVDDPIVWWFATKCDRATGEHKLGGLRAVAITGRAGYLYAAGQ